MSRRRHLSLFAWALGLCLLAPAATASHRDAVLGGDGELYLVRAGAYGELFPGDKAADPANLVLALDVVRPDAAAGEVERFLVPGTAGPEVEHSPSLLFEQASSTVFLVWESAFNVVHPSLKLAWFDGAAWSELIDVTGKPFTPKTSPLLAITRDTHEETAEDGSPVERHRTILHLLWVEEDAAGADEVLYSPLVLEDGVYKGSTGYLRLAAFDPSAPANAQYEVATELLGAPALEGGRDGRTVVAGFAAAATQRLVTLEIDVLPVELSHLADRVRTQIIDIGARYSVPGGLQHLAAAARTHLIEVGRAFHPEVAQTLADQVREYILAKGGGDLIPLADGVRTQIIDIGAKLSGRGLRQRSSVAAPGDDAAAPAQIVQVQAAGSDQPVALLQVRLASSRPAPQTGAGSTRLFLSESGQDVVVAWVEDGRVRYRDSAGAGWSETRELRVSDSLSLERALEIVKSRVRSR